jgi:hypothetical protein
MSYRNKTYVAFASENIHLYRLMITAAGGSTS